MRDVGAEDRGVSIGIKIGASVGGFVAFYALGMVLLGIPVAMEEAFGAAAGVAGALVALVVLGAVGFRVVRFLRGKGSSGRGALRWFALGFTSAMVVFGGCLMLLNSL
jgi:hypothetical protein